MVRTILNGLSIILLAGFATPILAKPHIYIQASLPVATIGYAQPIRHWQHQPIIASPLNYYGFNAGYRQRHHSRGLFGNSVVAINVNPYVSGSFINNPYINVDSPYYYANNNYGEYINYPVNYSNIYPATGYSNNTQNITVINSPNAVGPTEITTGKTIISSNPFRPTVSSYTTVVIPPPNTNNVIAGIDNGQATIPPQPTVWYYCNNPKGYYPQISACPTGWSTVINNKAITP